MQGKEFFKFDTSLTEPIQAIFAEGQVIATTGEFSYHQFNDTKDKYFYMSSDRIHDMLCLPLTSSLEVDAVLACQDRALRVLSGNAMLYQIAVGGPALAVERY